MLLCIIKIYEAYHDENGNLRAHISHIDGHEERFDENGILTDVYGYDNFGRPVHVVYDPDGRGTSYVTWEDGTKVICLDVSGNIVKEEWIPN